MVDLGVWAPTAHRVELESGGRRLLMQRDDASWWRLNAPFMHHGIDYAFRLDDQGPFPDPRSAWQPAGAHGPPCIVP